MGVYLFEPNTDEVFFATLDIDNHGGELLWKEVTQKVLPIIDELKNCNLSPFLVRSGGGHGIHITLFWDRLQKVKDIRSGPK